MLVRHSLGLTNSSITRHRVANGHCIYYPVCHAGTFSIAEGLKPIGLLWQAEGYGTEGMIIGFTSPVLQGLISTTYNCTLYGLDTGGSLTI